jgi:hypothetical protein
MQCPLSAPLGAYPARSSNIDGLRAEKAVWIRKITGAYSGLLEGSSCRLP